MWRLGLLMFLLLAMSACRYGTSAETFPPAQGPEGVTVRIEVASMGLRGELIEVRTDSLVLRVGGQIWLLGYETIDSSQFEGFPDDFGLGSGRTPDPRARGQMRLLARFPQGLSPELLSELLKVHGQTRFRTPGD